VIGNSARGPLDDLAVGMLVDEKTAKLIRDLHTQKAAAISRNLITSHDTILSYPTFHQH
jgi:hypothetical protein